MEVTLEEKIKLFAKYSGKQIEINVSSKITYLELKQILEKETNILPKRQKIMGLTSCKFSEETISLSSLKIKNNTKFILIGTPEKQVKEVSTLVIKNNNVIDDFDDDYFPDAEDVKNAQKYNDKLMKRLDQIEIRVINEPRKDKKLCVLDIDYTIFDCKSRDRIDILMRPHLDEFLTEIYKEYDIAFWSQTHWSYVEMKLTEMGILTSKNFKVSFCLDKSSMFSITSNHKGKKKKHEVKPLAFIWKKFDQFHSKNTVHIDDLSRNFVLNPKNGIPIKAFKQAVVSREKDEELKHLKDYLMRILTNTDDVTKYDHRDWKKILSDKFLK